LALDARGVALLGSRAADAGLTDAREALALVAALPARQRAVLTLQVSGRGYREIAARLRMTERTVEPTCCAPAPPCDAPTGRRPTPRGGSPRRRPERRRPPGGGRRARCRPVPWRSASPPPVHAAAPFVFNDWFGGGAPGLGAAPCVHASASGCVGALTSGDGACSSWKPAVRQGWSRGVDKRPGERSPTWQPPRRSSATWTAAGVPSRRRAFADRWRAALTHRWRCAAAAGGLGAHAARDVLHPASPRSRGDGACSASTCSQDTHRERCRCSAPVSSGTSTALGPGLRRTGPRWVDDRPAAVAESVVVRTGHTPHVRIGAGGEPVEQAHAFEVGQPGDGSAACARRPRRRRRSQSPRGGRRGRGRPPPGSTAGPRSAGRRRCRPITAHATAAGGADRADRRPGAGPCRRADASAVVRADGGVHDTERTGLVPRPLAAGDVCRQADGHRQRSRRASARRGQSMHRQSRDTRA
jgi:hypothetical protein